MSEKINEMDRRDFLKRGGILLATTAVAAGGVSSLTGCSPYVTSFAAKETLSYNFVKKISEAAAPHPYPYQKLDPTTCAERAYFGYFQRGG